MIEWILCARDAGVGYSSLPGVLEPGRSSGGVIKVVGIGETASSSSAAVEADLDKVGDGLSCSVVMLGSGTVRLEGESSAGLVVLELACLQNRCRGDADVTLSTSSSSSTCGRSSSMGELEPGVSGPGSGSGGIVDGFVSGVLKDLKRCSKPVKRGVGVGTGWESDC